MRALLIAMTGLGVALLVGGLLSFVFGACVLGEPLLVSGLGPLDGPWGPADYCFLGAVLSATGAGTTVSGRLGLCPGNRA